MYDTTESTGAVGRIEYHNVHTFIPLCYQIIIMIEEVHRVLRVDTTYSMICLYLTESNAVAVIRKPVGDGSVGTWL